MDVLSVVVRVLRIADVMSTVVKPVVSAAAVHAVKAVLPVSLIIVVATRVA